MRSLIFTAVLVAIAAQPAKNTDEKFKEDWDKAIELGKKFDKAEPEATEKALKKLDQISAQRAQVAMAKVRLDPSEGAGDLSKYGLSDHLNKASRAVAIDSKEFKKVARAFWGSEGKPDHYHLVSYMHRWGAIGIINRVLVLNAVENNLTPNQMTPDQLRAVKAAGGSSWLDR